MAQFVVPRVAFEATLIVLATVGGLAAIEGYEREAIVVTLLAGVAGLMSLAVPGKSLIFRR